MANIDFGITPEERLRSMQNFIQQMHGDFYGNGKKGLRDEFTEFLSTFNATEAERERQHKQNRNRLNTIIAILVCVAAYLAIVVSIKVH